MNVQRFCMKLTNMTHDPKTVIEQQYASHKFQAYNTSKLLKPQMVYVESLRRVPIGLYSNVIPFDKVENKGEQ